MSFNYRNIYYDSSDDELEFSISPVQNPPRPVSHAELRPNAVGQNVNRVVMGDPNRVVVPPVLAQNDTPYDQNLTSAHQYLGDGLCETTDHTIFEEGVPHTIPVIFLRLNLIPGQILPIIARSRAIQQILKYALTNNRSFGVSYKLNENGPTFGTIAEIYEHSAIIENYNSIQIKAKGYQRFKILSVTKFPLSFEETIALAQIKILPEITLPHPYHNLCLHPRKRNLSHSAICRKRDMWQTQWPDWVYKQFDAYQLAKRLAEKIKMLYKDVKISDDPNVLSFQVTRLGVFNPEQISNLLGIETTNLRLHYELIYWNQNQSLQKFICARSDCHSTICNMSSVFPMSPEGPQGTYCNSWGQIHDMITVTELDNDLDVITVGGPSSECCWFPGYKWIIILCPNCHSHLGWRYIAADDSSLVPRIFYGLTMSAVTSIRKFLPSAMAPSGLDVINEGDILVSL